MEWLKDGWETKWMGTKSWPENISGEELQKRLLAVEKVGKTPAGSGDQVKQHMAIYMQELMLAMFAAARWEHDHKINDKEASIFSNILYHAELSKYLEAYLEHPADVEDQETNDLALHCSAFMIDHCKFVMRSLAESPKIEARKVSHGIHLLRTLCVSIDRHTPYHQQRGDLPLPDWLPSHPFLRFTNAASLPGYSQTEDRACTKIADVPKKYLRIKLLLEYFGNGSAIPGFQLLVSLIYASVSQKLSLEIGEVILRFVAIAIEELKDHKRNMFLAPCLDMLRHVYTCYATQRLDKISVSTVTMIMTHLRIILRSLLPSETAEYLIMDMQKRQRDQFMQFLHPSPAVQRG